VRFLLGKGADAGPRLLRFRHFQIPDSAGRKGTDSCSSFSIVTAGQIMTHRGHTAILCPQSFRRQSDGRFLLTCPRGFPASRGMVASRRSAVIRSLSAVPIGGGESRARPNPPRLSTAQLPRPHLCLCESLRFSPQALDGAVQSKRVDWADFARRVLRGLSACGAPIVKLKPCSAYSFLPAAGCRPLIGYRSV